MSFTLRELKEKSQKRKKLLAQTFGVSNVGELRQALGTGNESSQGKSSRKELSSTVHLPDKLLKHSLTDELVYKDSSTFLKGTQSSNPHNDYCQHFVDTGQRPQNFIRDVGLADRFEEYPKLRELIKLKDDLIACTATPPMFLKCDPHTFNLNDLQSKFDVILIEPPLEEYQRTSGISNLPFWTWEQIMQLDIGEVAAARSFVFLWCGSSEGLDMGRNCLRRWGFRRCEDICWIRTNTTNPGHSKNLEAKAVFQRTKEHCLMGIKGTVRRSTDGDFIHANVDIDLIISEENEFGLRDKPVEIFHIIEHFCLGRRRFPCTCIPDFRKFKEVTQRQQMNLGKFIPLVDFQVKASRWARYNIQEGLHVFGRDSTIRAGWLTLGPELTNSNFNSEVYASYFSNSVLTTGCTERIEALRPKSPPQKGKSASSARGRGSGRGSFLRGRGRGR